MNVGYDVLVNEYIVFDEEYFVFNIDCVWEKEGEISLVDIKIIYWIDKEFFSWQLFIYVYFFERQNFGLKVRNLYGVWFCGDKFEFIFVECRFDEEVMCFMECEVKGEKYFFIEIVFVGNLQLMIVVVV